MDDKIYHRRKSWVTTHWGMALDTNPDTAPASLWECYFCNHLLSHYDIYQDKCPYCSKGDILLGKE